MKIIFDQPAANWQEALVLGNGRIGAAVYGGTDVERIALNEDTLWSGYPAKTQKEMPRGYLDRIRQLLQKEKCVEAMEYAENLLTDSEDVQMYVPFGNLFLEMEGKEKVTEYRRQLNLETAEVTITYKKGENSIRRDCLISQPHQIMGYRIQAERPVTVRIWTEGGYLRESRFAAAGTGDETEGVLKSFGRCPGRNPFSIIQAGMGEAVPRFSDNPAEQGMRYEGWGKIVSPDGQVVMEDSKVVVKNAKEITIYYGIRSGFAGYDKHPELEGRDPGMLLKKDIACCGMSYEEIRKVHLEEYRKYYGRVTFELKGEVPEDKDMKQRLWEADQGTSDPGLAALLFQYGRYLLIACSRPGTQAANLQGIWNAELIPPWFCDYTININTEMNYWMTGPCNLAEMGEPLKQMCLEMLEDGKATARSYFACEGVCCFHNVDIWRKTTPASGKAMWNFWPMGYAWLCRNLYDQYTFTTDKEYLREIYPVLRENVRFCLASMKLTERGWAFTPATSPENEFLWEGQKVSIGEYSENVHAIIRNLLRDYLECCETLDIWDATAREVRDRMDKIVPTRIDSQGRILEWEKERTEADPRHRHLSHLYELYPGRGIQEKSGPLWEGARNSLLGRGDEGTGWSLAWKILMWARMKDGAHAGRMVKRLFHLVDPSKPQDYQGGGLYPNLLCAHPPYQIDGNLGYSAGVAEMLMQSQEGEVHILPARPPEWKEGQISGLRARGGITVGIWWKDEQQRVCLKSDRDQEIILRMGEGESRKVALKEKEEVWLFGGS